MGFLFGVKDDPRGIISIVKIMQENIKRGYLPEPTSPGQISSRKCLPGLIEKILFYEDKVEENGQVIIDIYDDLLDELVNSGLTDFM
jgi:hypothetical protein